MKGGINRILNFFGYEIIRKKGKASKKVFPKGEPFKLEFVGPSGVGKTTIANSLIENTEIEQKIISREQLIMQYPVKSGLKRIHRILLDKKIINLSRSSIAPQDKIKLLNYFERVIYTEISSYHVGGKNLLILDEGIIHNFAPELIEMNFRSKDVFELFKNRLICFCLASEELISQNLMERSRSSKEVPVNGGQFIQKENLLSVNDQLEITNSLREKMKNHNIPYIQLDLQKDSLEVNVNKIKYEIFQHYSLQQ